MSEKMQIVLDLIELSIKVACIPRDRLVGNMLPSVRGVIANAS